MKTYIDSKDYQLYYVGNRIQYKNIISIDWMLEHGQYSMIIKKLKDGEGLEIKDETMLKLLYLSATFTSTSITNNNTPNNNNNIHLKIIITLINNLKGLKLENIFNMALVTSNYELIQLIILGKSRINNNKQHQQQQQQLSTSSSTTDLHISRVPQFSYRIDIIEFLKIKSSTCQILMMKEGFQFLNIPNLVKSDILGIFHCNQRYMGGVNSSNSGGSSGGSVNGDDEAISLKIKRFYEIIIGCSSKGENSPPAQLILEIYEVYISINDSSIIDIEQIGDGSIFPMILQITLDYCFTRFSCQVLKEIILKSAKHATTTTSTTTQQTAVSGLTNTIFGYNVDYVKHIKPKSSNQSYQYQTNKSNFISFIKSYILSGMFVNLYVLGQLNSYICNSSQSEYNLAIESLDMIDVLPYDHNELIPSLLRPAYYVNKIEPRYQIQLKSNGSVDWLLSHFDKFKIFQLSNVYRWF